MPTSAPPFSNDVSLFILEDVGIVFSEAAQEIYELNTTATWIWCQLEDDQPLEGLPAALAQTFGFAEAAARRHLSETLEAWRDLGFLESGDSKALRKPAAAKRRKRHPRSRLPQSLLLSLRQRLAGSGAWEIRTYRSLGGETVVVYPTEATMALVDPAIAHLAQSRRVLAPQSLIEIEPQGDIFDVKRDGTTAYRDVAPEELTPIVQYLVHATGIERSDYRVALHAGAVACGERVVVLPGSAGSGKTTLTAALLSEGFRFLSDDLLLMGEDLKIEGVPFALGIKDSGVAPLLPYYPELPSLTLHHRRDGKKLRYLSAPIMPRVSRQSPLRLAAAWVIFPKYRPDCTTALKPLPKSQALRRLMESSTLALPLTRKQIETFIRWLEALDCYDLQVNALADAVAAVKKTVMS